MLHEIRPSVLTQAENPNSWDPCVHGLKLSRNAADLHIRMFWESNGLCRSSLDWVMTANCRKRLFYKHRLPAGLFAWWLCRFILVPGFTRCFVVMSRSTYELLSVLSDGNKPQSVTGCVLPVVYDSLTAYCNMELKIFVIKLSVTNSLIRKWCQHIY